MKKTKKKIIAVLSALLMTVSVSALTGCSKTEAQTDETDAPEAVQTETVQGETAEAEAETASADDLSVHIGEGAHTFLFTVEDADGSHTDFTVSTDETIVGTALQQLGLIDGEQGAYGLYVKTVNGITADYDTDGAYWAFYTDGEMALTGVDSAEIEDGHSYAFVWTEA